ncbi:MAG: 16S rRNA (cytidine(1402)-2'-O)-methyltransferase [Myxococcota bacterium]
MKNSKGKLYIVATPIGNLGDLSERAREVLKAADYIAAESRSSAKKLAAVFSIHTPVIGFRESSRERQIPKLVELLEGGKNIALITEGGTPLISDPGTELVASAVERGISVSPIPGPSALIAALMASPLAGEFYFVGFLPRRKSKLVELLKSKLESGVAVVAFESPQRIKKTLAALEEEFKDDLEITLAREVTKINESFHYGSPPKVASELAEPVKGEITLVMKLRFEIRQVGATANWKAVARALAEVGARRKEIAKALSKPFAIETKIIYDYLVDETDEER